MNDQLWLIPAILVGFAAFWTVLCFVLSRFGWATLAREYPDRLPVSGKSWRMRSGRVGPNNYSGCLNLTANPEGLRLAVFFLFRPGHAPVFIPWGDMRVSHERFWFLRMVRLTLARCPSVPVLLQEAVVEQIAKEVGRVWPERIA
jgi:hypothetical protein